ncbi:MAG: hypothetical protein ACI8PV_001636, partial [Dinoroseobacter sp.]
AISNNYWVLQALNKGAAFYSFWAAGQHLSKLILKANFKN